MFILLKHFLLRVILSESLREIFSIRRITIQLDRIRLFQFQEFRMLRLLLLLGHHNAQLTQISKPPPSIFHLMIIRPSSLFLMMLRLLRLRKEIPIIVFALLLIRRFILISLLEIASF